MAFLLCHMSWDMATDLSRETNDVIRIVQSTLKERDHPHSSTMKVASHSILNKQFMQLHSKRKRCTAASRKSNESRKQRPLMASRTRKMPANALWRPGGPTALPVSSKGQTATVLLIKLGKDLKTWSFCLEFVCGESKTETCTHDLWRQTNKDKGMQT